MSHSPISTTDIAEYAWARGDWDGYTRSGRGLLKHEATTVIHELCSRLALQRVTPGVSPTSIAETARRLREDVADERAREALIALASFGEF
jgi:hypothetical protein